MNRQAELVKQMSDRDLILNVYATQVIILAVAFLLSFIFWGSPFYWVQSISWSFPAVLIGMAFAVTVVTLEIILDRILPEEWMDDGGINNRLFKNLHPFHILILTAMIGISEEILFRGVLQSQFGLIIASLLFIVVHLRYLSKPFLMGFMTALSFSLGLLFLWTGNLLAVITAHFFIDFFLGLYIRYTHNEQKGDGMT